jgi:hypothetical protein
MMVKKKFMKVSAVIAAGREPFLPTETLSARVPLAALRPVRSDGQSTQSVKELR